MMETEGCEGWEVEWEGRPKAKTLRGGSAEGGNAGEVMDRVISNKPF